MPLRDFRCETCAAAQERYYGPGQLPRCQCGGTLTMQDLSSTLRKTAAFPFETTHLDGSGTPIVVESLGHLRALERTFGVTVHAFSQDSVDSPKDLPEHRPGGREFEGERWWKKGRR